ncbi:MAG: hypothetical protein ACLTM8_10755 [Veillonella parvula]
MFSAKMQGGKLIWIGAGNQYCDAGSVCQMYIMRSSAHYCTYNQYNVKVAGRNRAGIANVQAAAINAQIVCYTKAVKEST